MSETNLLMPVFYPYLSETIFEIRFMQFCPNFSAIFIISMTFMGEYITIRSIHYFLVVINLQGRIWAISLKSEIRLEP